MIELQGKYNTAKVFTTNIENEAASQIIELCNQESFKDSKIRIMPDTHAGAGCTIGTTMTITNKIVPNLVGVDIGCGVFVVKISEKNIDFDKLDKIIRDKIPHGQNVRDSYHAYNKYVKLNNLICKDYLNIDRAHKSIGTLGGGNHFVEINKGSQGNLYLVIHSGSRYLGKQIAEYYQDKAIKYHKNKFKNNLIVDKLKSEERHKEIEAALKSLKVEKIKEDLCYLEGKDFNDYLHDMEIAQWYAQMNREAIADEIIDSMDLNIIDCFNVSHNFIDTKSMILRKGAISSKNGEKVLIPINMRDGSILAIGKGNEDWNYSAPHGAGRLMSRGKAKELISLDDFKESMEGIWTTSVNQSTLDESPMAYKPIQEIIDNINDTVDIVDILVPLYNFKSN